LGAARNISYPSNSEHIDLARYRSALMHRQNTILNISHNYDTFFSLDNYMK
jgi:hypothetical protein